MSIDQMVFGYNDGHRLLAASIQLPEEDTSLLLGASDAAVGTGRRLLTGTPLARSPCYALCFTWPAPESTRPGAVWSHVLIIDFETIRGIDDPARFLGLARRPSGDLTSFTKAISFGSITAVRETPDTLNSALLLQVVAATYARQSSHTVLTADLGEAELALAAVWRAQWPALRCTFAFRTRDQVRSSSRATDIVVARRVHGLATNGSEPVDARWIRELGASIGEPRSSKLQQFLMTFGPADTPDTGALAALAELYTSLDAEAPGKVRQRVESRYPHPGSGNEIKRELFGRRPGPWWNLPEESRVTTLLGTLASAWDVTDLNLVQRLGDAMDSGALTNLLAALPSRADAPMKGVMVQALRLYGKRGYLEAVIAHDRALGAEWILGEPSIAEDSSTWKGLSVEAAESLLTECWPCSERVLLAAMQGGQSAAVATVAGLHAALRLAARQPTLEHVRLLMKLYPWDLVVDESRSDDATLLAVAAASGNGGLPGLVGALERRRGIIDEAWLGAAVLALTSGSEPSGVTLQVVFGPLHYAITDDRLPRRYWKELGTVLPEAPDPALRLRRMVTKVSRDEAWDADAFRRALRDAGPYADELVRDLDSTDPITGLLRSILGIVRWYR